MKSGDIVSIRHYSGKTWFKSVVLKADNSLLTLKLTVDFAVLNFLDGDPVVLGYEAENEIYIASSVVCGIDPDNSYICIKIEESKSLKNQREHERFPVSFYANLKTEDSDEYHVATVKNMSFDGMMINSKVDIALKKNVELTIYPTFQEIKIDDGLDKTIIYLKAEVVRKDEISKGFEYGLKITYIDAHNQNLIRLFLQNLKSMQIVFLKDLKEHMGK